MNSGRLAQYFCLRAPPCLSLCRCLDLLHPSDLQDNKDSQNMGLANRHQVLAPQVSSLQTGLF